MSKTIEETYQKKTPLEHILLRPDTYIGSVEPEEKLMYVWDEQQKKIVQKMITYVPGLYKIFDEIIVNAADNKIRDPTMTTIKVNIDPVENTISVLNDGKGVPIVVHAKEKVYVPELIFGQLLTSSNYDDKEKKVTGGRNGYGAKLCNIFSKDFIVETADRSVKKYYKQVYKNNMSITGNPEISGYSKPDFTKITFKPDLKRFKMESLDEDIVSLLKKRVYDLSGIVKDVKVYLNDEKLNIKGFKQYVQLYLNENTNVIHQIINDRWELAFTVSEEQFQQVSFVNSICTSKGGSHVNHVIEHLIDPIAEHIKKKHKELNVRPFQIKSCMFIFINSLIDNPAFDSQTKENLTLRVSSFGSRCGPMDDFVKQIIKNTELVEKICLFAKAKASQELKKTDGAKTTKIVGIPKLEDANYAGKKNSSKCTLILTEGDSAKTLAVAGLSVVGRDLYGVFPLKGKLLNVREASNKQILENPEIIALKKIIGLQHNKEYKDTSSLRYGHIMIMTDQDHDGSHIKGLLINFFDYFYPSLLEIPYFLQEFITPIVIATKHNEVPIHFFTLPEAEEYKNNSTGWKFKYYKGLGTSTSAEAKEYFKNLDKHVKTFTPLKPEDKELIDLAFNKKKSDSRKNWLLGFVKGTYLDQSVAELSISEFINKELILFSMADNIRSIPSLIDGLKPGQRKVIFSCFKKKLKGEIKVQQLVGYISENADYHHGEQSLSSTIVSLAQDFVGSNNINLLLPVGQFGSRLQGGKDSASPRYIFTALSPLTRLIFHEDDDAILTYLNESNQVIEPEYYVPIIPMVLVNGAEGIGTGWSTNIPNFNPRDVVKNIKKLLNNEPLEEMKPYYRNFKGTIDKIAEGRYQINGIYSETDCLVITELPIGVWTQNYKEYLESLVKKNVVKDFYEYHTEKTVNFHVYFANKISNLKLSTTISLNNMICFDQNLQIKKYNTPEDILKEFFYIRLKYYMMRKEKLLETVKQDLEKMENKKRFILEVVTDSLIINKRKRQDIIQDLEKRGYVRYDDYEYLLSMKISNLTYERIEKIKEEYERQKNYYDDLLNKAPKDFWLEDLQVFEEKYDKMMAEEAKEYEDEVNNRLVKGVKKKITKTTDISVKETKGKKTTKRTVKTEKTVTSGKRKKVTNKSEKVQVRTEIKGNNRIITEGETNIVNKKRNSLMFSESTESDAPWKKYNNLTDSQ